MEFQEELSDMLLLKMLQAATRAAADKDKVSVFPYVASFCFSMHLLFVRVKQLNKSIRTCNINE